MNELFRRQFNQKFVFNSAMNDVRKLIESADEYSRSMEDVVNNLDFRSILYVTKPEDKDNFENMVISMTQYEFEESKKRNITNKRIIVLCEEERTEYWKEVYKDFEDQLQIFDSFNILSMTLLNYLTDKNIYTVVCDTDISDAIIFEGINCMQAFLQIPFISDGKIAYHLWCAAGNVSMITCLFDDLTPTKLIFKGSYEEQEVQDIYGKDELLKEPSDFSLFSNNMLSEWGNKNLTESYVNYRKPLGG